MSGQPVQLCDLFITSVDKVGPLLKLWGQVDRQTSVLIEQMLLDMLKIFEQQNFVVPITSLQPGLLCCAKYKDGIYYRAQVRNLKTPIPGTVEVRFIDYGNIESIPLENIRLLDDQKPNLRFIKPQASEFILAGVVHTANAWDEQSLAFVHHEIAYTELKTIIVYNNPHYSLVKILREDGTDFAGYLAAKGLVTPISPQSQEIILRKLIGPAATPQQIRPTQQPSLQFRPAQKNPELFTYKPECLPPNTEHMVYISYVEDGPYLFSIQLQSMEVVLEQLMQEINSIPLQNFTTPLLPGNPCLARCLEDNTVCRGVVLNLVENKCKTYYVDFGNSDILPFSNIYQIPYNNLQPKVMSMRFTLNGLKNVNVTNEMKCAFKEYVTNKLLKLKVLRSEDLIQYCELYDESGKNVLEVLYELSGEFKSLTMSKGAKHDVIVSYIEGCKKFFVQLKDCTVSLNNLMLALASTSPNMSNLAEIKPNQACCAFYSGDNQWYRAKIVSLEGDNAKVKYVDYGNEEIVPKDQLKRLDSTFVNILPAQAIECCLLGYQNMSFNTEIENAFESLTLECQFTMKVMGKLNNVLLVDLFDSEGNNVAALLIEKLAAQKAQSFPTQVASSILNDAPSHIRSFSPKDRSPKQENWRSPENNKTNNWRQSENKNDNWRSPEKEGDNKGWRSAISPSEEKPNNR